MSTCVVVSGSTRCHLRIRIMQIAVCNQHNQTCILITVLKRTVPGRATSQISYFSVRSGGKSPFLSRFRHLSLSIPGVRDPKTSWPSSSMLDQFPRGCLRSRSIKAEVSDVLHFFLSFTSRRCNRCCSFLRFALISLACELPLYLRADLDFSVLNALIVLGLVGDPPVQHIYW